MICKHALISNPLSDNFAPNSRIIATAVLAGKNDPLPPLTMVRALNSVELVSLLLPSY